MTLTYFKARSILIGDAFEWGKVVKWKWGETRLEYANGQKIYVYENNLSQGGCLPLPRGYIHVYDHNIQYSSSLSILRTGELKFV